MDAATREQRRRIKAQTGKRGELPAFEARGRGTKAGIATFPSHRCSHREGGKTYYSRKKRPDGTTYSIPFVKGGILCPKDSVVRGKCLEHAGR